MKLVYRTLRAKTFHPVHGDRLIDYRLAVREDRPLDDPWFEQRAKQLTKWRHGSIVEWRVY